MLLQPVYLIIDHLPVANSQLEAATQKDPTLSKVWTYTCQGWPQDFPKELKYFSSISSQLTVEGRIVLRGSRVDIPQSLKGEIKKELHLNHL